MHSWRGFRYQTGEAEEIAQTLKTSFKTEVDIDHPDELDGLIADLEKYDVYRIEDMEFDYNAISVIDQPEFYVRINFYSKSLQNDESTKDKILYIDFFMVEELDDKCLDLFF